MAAQNLGMRIDTMRRRPLRKQRTIFRMLCFEKKNLEGLTDYTVMPLTNPHTIRGRPTLKDVERFRNGSFHELYRLKALKTLKEVNTSDVGKARIFMSRTSMMKLKRTSKSS